MILGLFLGASLALPLQDDAERTSWTIHGATVYTAAGDPIEDGVVRVRDGKIDGIGSGSGSNGEGKISVAAVTPGLVDLSLRVMRSWSDVEHGSEVSPHMRAQDALDVYDARWVSIARTGVSAIVSRQRSIEKLPSSSRLPK